MLFITFSIFFNATYILLILSQSNSSLNKSALCLMRTTYCLVYFWHTELKLVVGAYTILMFAAGGSRQFRHSFCIVLSYSLSLFFLTAYIFELSGVPFPTTAFLSLFQSVSSVCFASIGCQTILSPFFFLLCASFLQPHSSAF